MKVEDMMTSPVQYCAPETNVAAAAAMMWDSDCGMLPVVNSEGKVIGVITDRDICMAVATKGRLASEITVWETITGQLHTCAAHENIRHALATMANRRVRRLPVVDADGRLQGVLSMNDILLNVEGAKGKEAREVTDEDVVRVLKAISKHRMLLAA